MYSYGNNNLLTKKISLFKNFSWGNFLDGTQKTLGVINQAIPIVYQVKPIFNNAKTMFRIADQIRSNDSYENSNDTKTISSSFNEDNLPVFYI